MDLVSLVFTLRPLPSPNFNNAPCWWGYAAQTLFLRTVNHYAPELAEELHDAEGLRPFTTSSLIGHFPAQKIDLNGSYSLRITTCKPEISEILLAAISHGGLLAPGAKIELDYLPFRIESVTGDPRQNPWAGINSYQELASNYLFETEKMPEKLKFELYSPTAFKTQGKMMLFPLPGLLFGSLLDRWNSFSPVLFEDDVCMYIEEALAVSRFKLESKSLMIKKNVRRSGSVGTVVYSVLDPDPFYLKILHVLGEFSLYAGAGISTAMGLGQIRKRNMNRVVEG